MVDGPVNIRMIRMISVWMVAIVSMSAISMGRIGIWPGVGYYHGGMAIADVDVITADIGFIAGGDIVSV
jgi:hypothetical protein